MWKGGRVDLLLCLCLLYPSDAAVYYGKQILETDSFMVFLGKFVFDVDSAVRPGEAGMSVSFEGFSPVAGQQFVLFDDQPSSWPRLSVGDLTCQETLDAARTLGGQQGVAIAQGSFNLTVDITEKERPRYWYAVMLNCGSPGVSVDDWTLTFLNPGDDQFGVDLYGVTVLYGTFGVAFAVLVGIVFKSRQLSLRAGMLHPVAKLHILIVLLQTSAVFAYLLHYAVYGFNGIGLGFLDILAPLLSDLSMLGLLVLLLLVSKGWTITFSKLTNRRGLAWAVIGLSLAYTTLFLWNAIGIPESSTSYEYDSIPGVIVVLSRSLCFLWFIWSLRRTMDADTRAEQRRFYYIFGVVFGIWFAALPITVMVAALLDVWMRAKVVDALQVSVHAVALYALTYLLWPTNFARTSCIATDPSSLPTQSAVYEEI